MEATPAVVLFETRGFASDHEGQFEAHIGGMFDLEPGQHVTVSGRFNTKDLLIGPLAVTDVDVAADTVSGVAAPGAEVMVATVEYIEVTLWGNLTFQFGPNNRNPDSLNEHLAFRQAVAHAIGRQALVDAIPEAGYAIDSYVEAFLPGLAQSNWPSYDPVTAQLLLDQLCSDLGRDCEAEPPVAVFSTSTSDARVLLASLLQSMLGAVGIQLQLDLEDPQEFWGETFDRWSSPM